MKTTNRLKKPTNHATSHQRWPYFILIFLVLAALFVWLHAASIYSINPESTQQSLRTLFDKIQPKSGELLVTAINDEGCDDSSSVGLETRIICTIRGYKYYKYTQGNLAAELKQIDATLTEQGWYSKGVAFGYTLEQALSGTETTSVHYAASDRKLKAHITLHVFNGIDQEYSIDKALEETGKLSTLTPGDRAFGISTGQIYWACNHGIFQLHCLQPPSPVK